MNLKKLQKVIFFVFILFLIFSGIVIMVGSYMNNTLISIIIFILFIYSAYYLFLKTFFED